MIRTVLIATLCVAVALSLRVDSHPNVTAACEDGQNNTIPLCTGAPVLMKTVPNGKLFKAGCGNDTFDIVHVYGTPYEQGYAHGQLQAAAMKQIPGLIVDYIERAASGDLPKWMPKWLADIILKYGAGFLFSLTWTWVKPFTPQRYIDEMQGIADGAGVHVTDVIRYNMFPETTKAACSIVGATGPATPNKKIAHLRALDIDATNPIKDFAQVTVYHSNNSEPNVANFAWSGMVGSLTGISDKVIGIGEKVWLHHAKDIEGTKGQPWMFILRDVLVQPSLDAAIETMRTANRTCAIHVGVGDSNSNQFRGLTIAQKAFTVYNDTSLNYPEHPILPGVMYWDKHAQPTSSYCLSDLLEQYYGQLDAETLALKVSAYGTTGNMHSISFDYENLIAFVANARKTNITEGNLNAYARQFTKLDIKKLFAEPQV